MSPSMTPLRETPERKASGPLASALGSDSFSASFGTTTGGGVARTGAAQSTSPAHNAAAIRRTYTPSGEPDPIPIDAGPDSRKLSSPQGAGYAPLTGPYT